MALVKLADYYLESHESYSNFDDIKNFDVYTRDGERVGFVYDILVDAVNGKFRYFVIDTGFWIFGKKVLLPVGRADVNSAEKRISLKGLNRGQVENLPNYDELETIDYDYEEEVRGLYRGSLATSGVTQSAAYDRTTYDYEQEPSLYGIPEGDDRSLKLYEERLIANKQRQKTGEVSIGKHVETDTARVAVPVEKERVVVERTSPTFVKSSAPSDAFRSGEVARLDVYEETPDIQKEAVVREEVRVKKVVDRDTVEAQETVRREKLDIDSQGRPIVEK